MDQFPLWKTQKPVQRFLTPRWAQKQLCQSWKENEWHSFTIVPPRKLSLVQLQKILSSWFLPGERKRSLKHTSKVQTGLVSVLFESNCWQERAPGWVLLSTKVRVWTSTHSLTMATTPAQHRSRRKPPTPGFSVGRLRVGMYVQCSSFWGRSLRVVSVPPVSEHW